MSLDLPAISGAQWLVLKADAAGAAVRAATGPASAAGIIPATALRTTLPTRPFVAWQEGVVSGESDEMRGIFGTWWVYDDPAQGYIRIKELLKLIESAYSDKNAIPWCATTVFGITQNAEDASLGGLYMRSISIVSRRL